MGVHRHLSSRLLQYRRGSTSAAFGGKNSEGTIEGIFSSFHESPPFPERFADIKKELWTENLIESWREVLRELEGVTGDVIAHGSQVRCVVVFTGSPF